MQRATLLSEIPSVTKPEPLDGDALEQFYVPADKARDPVAPPSSWLRDSLHEDPIRLLFASHPGSGKSTELNRLMREAKDDFWFLKLSVQQELDIAAETLSPIDLIMALMEKLYQAGLEEHLVKDKRVIEPVRKWLDEIVRETKVMREESLRIEAGGGIDGLLAQAVGLLARLRSAFALSSETAETVRRVVRHRIPELRNYCNLVLAEVSSNLKRRSPSARMLVIVEDTDKLDVAAARALFVEHTGLLADLQTSIIYTVPLFLIHSPDRKRLEARFETLTLPMIKTHTPKGEKFAEGWDVLHEIVNRRIDTARLIEPEALERAIAKTGGVLRDLLWVIHAASRAARLGGAERISVEVMEHGLEQLKNRYVQSIYGGGVVETEQLYEKMAEIARKPGKVPVDDALQILLYTQAVIEYNGSGWYDVHPLMREALYEMGWMDGRLA